MPTFCHQCFSSSRLLGRLPRTVQLSEILKGVLPTDVRDFIADRVFGVYHTMDDFTGRDQPST